MKQSRPPSNILQLVKQRPAVFAIAGVLLLAALVFLFTRGRSAPVALSSHEVKRADFLISIVEGGTLEAVEEISIRNEVEGTARIIRIVPEGSYVKAGDLLVELDSSASQDAVNQQQIAVEKARFALIQAEQQLEIQKITAETDLKAADLKVEFAETDLKKYLEGEARQLERNAQIEITNVIESLAIARDRLEWTRKLYTNGFETKSTLDKDTLTVSQSELKLEQASNTLWMLREFDAKKKRRELEAAVNEARQAREKVRLQGDRTKAQYQADVATQKSTLELNQSKLERDLKQLTATKIYAPQDGLVVYSGGGGGGGRFSNESMIEEGAVVRNRQELIKLPDVSQMKLLVRIHESHINQVHVGQLAFVVLDSMPDQRLRGVVNKVGILPDSGMRWSNPNLKVYATEILVTDPLPDVKPGVSARAEVVITNLENVLTVPIQAVSTRKGQQVVFLASAPETPVKVGIGMYNTKFIEITSGLKEGDHVLLAPPFNADEKDLGGSVLAEGEEVPTAASNQVARPQRMREDPMGGLSEREGNGRTGGGNGEGQRGNRGNREGGSLGGSPGGTVGAAGEGGARRGGFGGGSRTNFQEMIKLFDKNGDGQLDETERAAMRERFPGGRGGGGSRGGQPAEPAAR
jgi:HlyD family secretion protein